MFKKKYFSKICIIPVFIIFLFVSCKGCKAKNQQENNQNEETKTELLQNEENQDKNVSSEENENTEDSVINLEDSATILENLENNENATIEDEENLSEIEKNLEQSKLLEKLYINKLNELKILQFEDELLIPNDNSFIEKNKSTVSKSFYDDNYRLVKKEHWKIGSLIESKVEKTELYEYKENTMLLKQKKEITDLETKIYFYNDFGLLTSVDEYKIFEDKDYLVKKTTFDYDNKNRLKTDNQTFYTYDEKYKKITKKTVKTYKYINKENEELTPDSEFYEDGKLRIKNVYSDVNGTYTSEVYFDNNMSVKSFYENDLLKKEIFYVDGVEKRVQNYE